MLTEQDVTTEYLDRLEAKIRKADEKESAIHFEIDSSERNASVYRVWAHRGQNPGKVIGVFYFLRSTGLWEANAFDFYSELTENKSFATSEEAIAYIETSFLNR